MARRRTGPLEIYGKALKVTDADSLHDAIAHTGPRLLSHNLPYVVKAARWQRQSVRRREFRRNGYVQHTVMSSEPRYASLWDPYEKVAHSQVLNIIVDALANLPDEDIRLLWMHLRGHSDKEIQAELEKSKPQGKVISVALIRKRRQRTIERIRRITKSKLGRHV